MILAAVPWAAQRALQTRAALRRARRLQSLGYNFSRRVDRDNTAG
jgi:hypothetical protein